MMTRDYTNNCISENVGVCFDYALNFLNVDKNTFINAFLNSYAIRELENNNPKYTCGLSGVELCLFILDEFKIEYDSTIVYVAYDRSKEYWAGYIISSYVRHYNYTYSYAFSYTSLIELIEMYSKYHQLDNRHFYDKLNNLKRSVKSNLKRIRENQNFSQSELARLANISIRTLQAYEQKQKDINKADVYTVVKLSKILNCSVESLLEY